MGIRSFDQGFSILIQAPKRGLMQQLLLACAKQGISGRRCASKGPQTPPKTAVKVPGHRITAVKLICASCSSCDSEFAGSLRRVKLVSVEIQYEGYEFAIIVKTNCNGKDR